MDRFAFTQAPVGAHPLQAFGVIPATGQAFYFRCRIDKASLTISRNGEPATSFDDPNAAAHYAERLDLQLGQELDAEIATALVRRWVNFYLALA